MGIPEENRDRIKTRKKNVWRNYNQKLPKLDKRYWSIHSRSLKTPSRINWRDPHWDISRTDKRQRKNLKAVREKQLIMYRVFSIRLTDDFWSETIVSRYQSTEIKKNLVSLTGKTFHQYLIG